MATLTRRIKGSSRYMPGSIGIPAAASRKPGAGTLTARSQAPQASRPKMAKAPTTWKRSRSGASRITSKSSANTTKAVMTTMVSGATNPSSWA